MIRNRVRTLVLMGVLALAVLAVPASARIFRPLKIVGRTKPGSTATVVATISNPKNLTLAFGYFKRACAATYVQANRVHMKNYRNGGFGNYDGDLKRGRQTFRAPYSSSDPHWYVCAYVFKTDTEATLYRASFRWR